MFTPSSDVVNTANITAYMKSKGFDNYEDFYQWSLAHRYEYWDDQARELHWFEQGQWPVKMIGQAAPIATFMDEYTSSTMAVPRFDKRGTEIASGWLVGHTQAIPAGAATHHAL